MIKLWHLVGRILFLVTWPGIWLILRWSKRTRIAIRSGDHILVVKPWLSNGKWHLPGGGVHRHEDPLDALLREVAEETGLALDRHTVKKVADYTYAQSGLSFAYTEYSARLPEPLPPHRQFLEIAEVAWVPIASLNPSDVNSDVRRAVWPKG